ncbi:hypothetical protein G6742_000346 [Escherichia coli]|nr:hypothetical protein [Escherichia coli]EFJ1749942.1 hypothetical protein [Escherichia coli]HAV8932435.1 hypothetical protein [Escherichia coli]HAV9249460.1 hypothetical protein [Escherichia coli]HAW0312683.1 hypothetical protein [Escherichia coli]
MLRKILFYMAVTLSCSSVVADDRIYYQNFFWHPVSSVEVEGVSEGVVDDYVGYAYANLVFPGNGVYRVIARDCLNDDVLNNVKGESTYWIQYKDGYQEYSGLRFKMSVIDEHWTLPYNGSHLNGWVTKTSQFANYLFTGPENKCWSVGETTGVVMSSSLNRRARIKVEIPRGDAKPGHYVLNVPFRWMFEEHKYNNYTPSSPLHYSAAQILQSQGIDSYIKIPLTIVSKCNFNTSPINFSHGTMTGRNADGNQTKPYNLNVACTPGTSLSVKLLGTQKVSGKTDNYTQCGTGGMCELTFDNGKYDETMTVDSSKTLSIKSTYRLNDIAKPVAESFEGSGVLQVLVN